MALILQTDGFDQFLRWVESLLKLHYGAEPQIAVPGIQVDNCTRFIPFTAESVF
jgi:hypothetical protein